LDCSCSVFSAVFPDVFCHSICINKAASRLGFRPFFRKMSGHYFLVVILMSVIPNSSLIWSLCLWSVILYPTIAVKGSLSAVATFNIRILVTSHVCVLHCRNLVRF
jgi:hypothetical protein